MLGLGVYQSWNHFLETWNRYSTWTSLLLSLWRLSNFTFQVVSFPQFVVWVRGKERGCLCSEFWRSDDGKRHPLSIFKWLNARVEFMDNNNDMWWENLVYFGFVIHTHCTDHRYFKICRKGWSACNE